MGMSASFHIRQGEELVFSDGYSERTDTHWIEVKQTPMDTTIFGSLDDLVKLRDAIDKHIHEFRGEVNNND